jgi:hypothetical protein
MFSFVQDLVEPYIVLYYIVLIVQLLFIILVFLYEHKKVGIFLFNILVHLDKISLKLV